METPATNPIVIIGCGVIGASLAYYLTKKGFAPIIIENRSVAAAASGKAGGFLARDWGDGCTIPLHKLSYELHKELAVELELSSYRTIDTYSVHNSKDSASPSHAHTSAWVHSNHSLMDHNTAQVEPFELTTKLIEKAVGRGARLLIGQVMC